MPSSLATDKGRPHPLGATVQPGGVNFSVFSENADNIELLLFDSPHDIMPAQVINLDPRLNKTFHFWHVFVKGLAPGAAYAFRVYGPNKPDDGLRFNRNKVLLDPYSFGNTDALWRRADACGPADNVATSMRSLVIDTSGYNWEGDVPLCHPMEDSIIYEMHAAGFTKSPTSKVRHPGTFAGLIEKIPYLEQLGITAVELLPVFDFDETAVLREYNGKSLTNYWGYSTLSFFAPQCAYCVDPAAGAHLTEFRDMVKALHRAGIEVILDVVFNHTDEGNENGPTFSFRGFENTVYYFLVPDNKQFYFDYTGCGNTLNCNHPILQKLILECLRHWVNETHVDGFRFDLGSVLARGEDGAPLPHPPIVWQIELDEQLADTKVIAEAWDAAGLYQIGHFPGDRWAEWNGKYRDDIRRFVKGDPGLIGSVAWRLAGSADLYQAKGELPINSINFITCHDGFTMNDLVSYNDKHNEANGEDSRDGANDNNSWNCGIEGPSADPNIEALRERQIRNFATILMLSRGVPMFFAGDEVRRTQQGNNNAYCQDNEINWFDWTMVDKHEGVLRFWQSVIAFRKRFPALRSREFYGADEIAWHGAKLGLPYWEDPNARVLSFTIPPDLHVMLNMFWETLDFEVPAPAEGRRWFKAIDTAEATPVEELPFDGATCQVEGRSIVVLVAR